MSSLKAIALEYWGAWEEREAFGLKDKRHDEAAAARHARRVQFWEECGPVGSEVWGEPELSEVAPVSGEARAEAAVEEALAKLDDAAGNCRSRR